MKIQCDVCDKGEATIFCVADEAALCDDCDRRVHHANKLANKHTRYSLLHPPFKESPLCDICQERRALLFCQEDRAILCRECDVPIHRSNEHTQKHNRFLLTGVKLSSSSPPNQASSSSSALSTDMKISRSSAKRQNCPPSSVSTAERSLPLGAYQDENHTSDAGSISTSSISEYLMETLPGWHVDEFLDPSSTASNGYCKTFDHMLPVVDPDLVTDTSSSASKDFANYSPQVPHQFPHLSLHLSQAQGPFFHGMDQQEKARSNRFINKQSDDGFLYGSSHQHPFSHNSQAFWQ
ncbi:hypothetical protein ACJRO7_027777 [Eucalyptus globulus]|uniref:B box-type domain-containing protein n=1 Tax=Eucalyptus globulus TaxID=34317 RepID=A0ABD3JX78_EUCGL